MDKNSRSFVRDFLLLCEQQTEKNMIIYDAGNGIRRFSYRDILSYCKKYKRFFNQKGLKRGDTIVTVMPNTPEAIICFFASVFSGINYAPLPCTVTNREFINWLGLVKPKLIIKKSGIAEFKTDILVAECDCDGDMTWLPDCEDELEEDSDAKIYLMTSGTTGLPKAMSINADCLWNSGNAFIHHYGIEDSEYRFWNYLPMSYLGGLFNLALIPLCCKGSFVISEPFSGKTILNFWSYVEKHEITALWFVPSIVQGLLELSKLVGDKNAKHIGKHVKIGFLGTAPIQLEQKQSFEEIFGIQLYENFALSETTFLTAEASDHIRYREQGSVGMQLPYVDIKYIPVEGVENSYQIWVKTPYLFNGYLSQDGKIEREVDGEGYFNTKDLGRLNDDNILVLGGRDRDIIKKGGLFVSLVEIETVVKALPSIKEAAAVPVKHKFYGESYYLFVIFQNNVDEKKATEDLHLWMLDNIVPYKIPEKIISCDNFPRTSSGKIQKRKLLEGRQEEQ